MAIKTRSAVGEKFGKVNHHVESEPPAVVTSQNNKFSVRNYINLGAFRWWKPNVRLSTPSIGLKHLLLAVLIRVSLIVGAEYADKYFRVNYTDVDYIVFTDAARHVTQGKSPYQRSTYRYSPLLAYLNLANVYVHPSFGKFVFALVDVFVSFLVYEIALLFSSPKLARTSSLIWLYNPISIVISTRGNSDSFICLFVLVTLYARLKGRFVLSGVFLALSIHLRMYPLLFSLPLFLSLRNMKARAYLVLSCGAVLALLTGGFYALYGREFISEAYLYHLSREDVKHNYSVHFLSQYLHVSNVYVKLAPLLILQVLTALKFSNLNDLPMCLFLQTYLFVSFSPVLTCQYFIWYISLLTPILPQFVRVKQIAVRFVVWILVQLLWLVPAYYLEFHGINTFLYVAGLSCLFFLVNINMVLKLIQNYSPMNKIE